VKFLLDRCAGARLAQWLRDQGHDVLEARSKEPDPGDRELLIRSVAEDRILVTMDKDFGWLVWGLGEQHRGLLRLPDVPVAERIALVERVLKLHAKELTTGWVVTVRGDRIRLSRPL